MRSKPPKKLVQGYCFTKGRQAIGLVLGEYGMGDDDLFATTHMHVMANRRSPFVISSCPMALDSIWMNSSRQVIALGVWLPPLQPGTAGRPGLNRALEAENGRIGRDPVQGDAKHEDRHLESYARSIGLDLDRWKICYTNNKYGAKIDGDQEEIKNLGFKAAQGFFINGRFLSGVPPLAAVESLVVQELKKAKRITKAD